MLLDELKVPFRWYTDPGKKLSATTACNGYRYKLITPADRLLPFMFRFIRDAFPHFPNSWKIYNADTGALVLDISVDGLLQLGYYTYGDYDYLVYKGDQPLGSLNLPTGFYYCEITFALSVRIATSEDFYVDCDAEGRIITGGDFNEDFNEDFGPLGYTPSGLPKYTKLEWWHNCDINNILYQTGYRNIIYIESDLIRDTPEYLEEGVEDGKKDFIPTFIKYIDKIKFDEYVPEYVVSALLLVKLHRNVTVTTKNDLYTGSAKNFNVDFSWQNDCYAVINCSFQQETTFLRESCCGNNTITDRYLCSINVTSVTPSAIGCGGGSCNLQLVVVHTGTLVLGQLELEYTLNQSLCNNQDIQATDTNIWTGGPYPSGCLLSGSVRGKCTNATNGHVSYTAPVSWEFTIP